MKKKHGGKRKGAGRKPGSFVNTEKKEPTVVMRVPVSIAPIVKELIKDLAAASPSY